MIVKNTVITKTPVITCVADDAYIMPLAVTLSSAVRNLKKYDHVDIYIIDGNVSSENKQKLESSVDGKKTVINWITPPEGLVAKIEKMNVRAWLNHMTYYRLMVPYILPENVGKVIMLDSDLVVKGDLGELWDMDMEGKYLIAAQNLDWSVSCSRGVHNYKELGLDPELKYFNSGVMVINVDLWCHDGVIDQILAYIKENEKNLKWCDQDGLNAVLAGKWKEMDRLWNYEALTNPYDENNLQNYRILHYTGPRKPWHYQFEHPTKKDFLEHLKSTAWSGYKDKKPLTLKAFILDFTRPIRHFLGLRGCQLAQLKSFVRSILFSIKYAITKSLSVKKRDDLPFVLNALGLKGKAVEIGVWQGRYSETILAKSRLSLLYSVDPWRLFGEEEYVDILNSTEDEIYKSYLITINRLAKFESRNKILKATSDEAADNFEDDSLDFIYIDAQHSYEACREDLNLWWPKLKQGGVFAGHDYLNGKLPEGDFGVKDAVDEFIKDKNLKLYVTEEQWPTWYLRKE